MKTLVFIFLLLNCISIPALAETQWVHGSVDIVESFPNKIVVRWNAINSQACSVNDAYFNESSMGGESQLSRAFSLAMAATASGKPLRLLVGGCSDGKQLATAAQLCANDDCSY